MEELIPWGSLRRWGMCNGARERIKGKFPDGIPLTVETLVWFDENEHYIHPEYYVWAMNLFPTNPATRRFGKLVAREWPAFRERFTPSSLPQDVRDEIQRLAVQVTLYNPTVEEMWRRADDLRDYIRRFRKQEASAEAVQRALDSVDSAYDSTAEVNENRYRPAQALHTLVAYGQHSPEAVRAVAGIFLQGLREEREYRIHRLSQVTSGITTVEVRP